MELKQLYYFLQLSKDKNFSKASKNLYFTQQALSKAIKRLEDELGVDLFIRSSSGVELSVYGEYFLEKATLIVNEIDETINEIKRQSKQEKAKLHVGFTFGSMSALNLDKIFKFEKNNPDIVLAINEYPDTVCEQMLNEGALDIACVVAPINTKIFNYATLLIEPLYLMISNKNSLAFKNYITMEDIKNEKFLAVNETFNAPKSLIHICNKAGFSPNIIFTSPETFLLQEMARHNKGIYLIPEHAMSSVNQKDVVFKLFPDAELTWKICLITNKSKPLTFPAKKFYEYLLEITN